MQRMEEMILNEGQVLPGGILKVGSFLNQQIDTAYQDPDDRVERDRACRGSRHHDESPNGLCKEEQDEQRERGRLFNYSSFIYT